MSQSSSKPSGPMVYNVPRMCWPGTDLIFLIDTGAVGLDELHVANKISARKEAAG